MGQACAVVEVTDHTSRTPFSDYGLEAGDGPSEGPCDCHVRRCSGAEGGGVTDGDCPVCSVASIYDPCPLQGFGCGWHPDLCDCCEPEQRALVASFYEGV